jgi:hypothetical protein
MRHAACAEEAVGASTNRRIVVHCSPLLFAPAGMPGGSHEATRRKAKFALGCKRPHC